MNIIFHHREKVFNDNFNQMRNMLDVRRILKENNLDPLCNYYGLLLDQYIIERPNVSKALIVRDSAVVCAMLITLILEDIPLIRNINKMKQYQDHFIAY